MERMRLTTWDSITKEVDTHLVEIKGGIMAEQGILARSANICTDVDKLSDVEDIKILGVIKGVKCITLIRRIGGGPVASPGQTLIDHFEEI